MKKKLTSKDHVKLILTERIAYRFLRLAGQVMQCLAEMYSPRYDLTVATWKGLSVIGACGPMSATELGRYTSLEPDKVTRTVDNLVRRNLVLRRQDPDDRRRVILTLSHKGKTVNSSIERVRNAIEVDLLNALNPNELRMLYSILDKLDERAAEIFSEESAWRQIVERVEAPEATCNVSNAISHRKR